MALATPDDLIGRLGRDLTDGEYERVTDLLEDVSAAVRLYTGQHFARDDYTWRTRLVGRYARLPQRPVHSVDSVANIDGDTVSHEWDGLDRVYVTGARPLVVDITYDAGPDTVPSDLVGVVSSIAMRSLGVDPSTTAISQESVDGYAFTIGSAGSSGAYGVLPAEARILDHFRGPKVGTMRVAW